MTIRITLAAWPQQQADARVVRQEVFLIEQNVPVELEWDDMDALSLHALAYDEHGQIAGTGRLLPDGHIGRMAVLKTKRGKGIGSAVLTALMQAARERGKAEVMLNAQLHAEAFYARFGFVREGEIFPDAGIAHVHMRCRLK